MKKIYKFLPLVLFPIAMILLGNSTGSIGGKTGSIGDAGINCTQCHTGQPQNATNWVTTNIPQTGYVPGQTYIITVTGTHTGVVKFGFELTAENATGTKVGTFVITNATQTKLTNGNKAVTHTSAGTTPAAGSKTWTVNWTAPNPAVGPVTFNAALNAANGNGTNQGDVIYLTSTTVQPVVLVNVTFQVDMTYQTVSPLGVHIAGSFQSWNPATTLLTLQGNNIYAVTIGLVPGTQALYKFINGITWTDVENVPSTCGLPPDNNRYFTVPAAPLVLPVVCFSSCSSCANNVNVTFRVDMSEQTVSSLGVHIAGSFQNWNPGSTLMTHQGSNIYAYTISLPSSETYQYKFVNGITWGGAEIVPGGCATGGNRYFTVPAQNTILDPVCFGSCVACVVPTVAVTFQVDMTYQTVSVDGVHLAGSFQGWDPAGTLMTLVSGKVYAATVNLEVGNSYEYKFVNGNAWGQDETVPVDCAVGDNRVITVPDVNTTLEPVCFAMCTTCPPPAQVDITFQVDMSNEIISPNGVHLAGSFNNWNYGSTPMTLQGNGIYSATVNLLQNDHHTWKFVNGNVRTKAESVPAECAESTLFNGLVRFFDVPGVNTNLDLVCFGRCEPCVPPPTTDVTFQVDMTGLFVSPNGVYLAGSWGWNPAATLMTDQGNGVYVVTLNLLENETYEYKFVNDSIWDGAELVPVECALNGNRYFTVPVDDTSLPLVCFGSCSACPPAVVVTFQVDMAEQTVSPEGVHIVGAFQGWNTATSPMTLSHDAVYTFTTTLLSGYYYEYKFINGISWDDTEIVPAGCAQNTNRYINVPDESTTLTPVCFGSCNICNPPTADVTFQVDLTGLFVSPNGVYLTGSFQSWNPATTVMADQGNGIYAVTLNLLANETYEYKFVNDSIWTGAESVPVECAQNGNRYFTVPADNTSLPLVCFGSCSACPQAVQVTFQVDMAEQTVSPEGVHIAGAFQGWNPETSLMTLSHDAVYTFTTTLLWGYYYEYKFINGTTWNDAEIVPIGCVLNTNRYITAPANDIILDLVCFGSCEHCLTISDGLMAYYPFNGNAIDESGNENHGTVFDALITEDRFGNANSAYWFDGLSNYVIVADAPSLDIINEISITGWMKKSSEVSWASMVTKGGDTGLQEENNYTIHNSTENGIVFTSSLDTICTSSVTIPLNEWYFITFVREGNLGKIFINGKPDSLSFVNYSEDFIPNSSSLYIGVDHPGSSDFFSGFLDDIRIYNRSLKHREILQLFNYPNTYEVNVTFKVDMSNETVAPEGVHLVGDFQNWDPAATMLTAEGSGIFSVTLPIAGGTYQTYKFINGNTFDGAELVPAECGVDDGFGGYKRFLNVPLTETELDVVCFSMCSTCTLQHSIPLKAGWNSLSSYVMPSETDIVTLLSDIYSELIIIQSMTEVYFPAENLNTIGTWDSQSAYKIKLSQDVTLTIAGTPENNKTLQLSAGWNMIPVIGNEPVSAETLFAPVTTDLIVVKGIASIEVFWPQYSINTIGNLLPGKAYFVKMLNPGTITFP
jgi:hypothetical protein